MPQQTSPCIPVEITPSVSFELQSVLTLRHLSQAILSFSVCKRQNAKSPILLRRRPAYKLRILQYRRTCAHLQPSLSFSTCGGCVSAVKKHLVQESVKGQPNRFSHSKQFRSHGSPLTFSSSEAAKLSPAGSLV